jgi:hypothetical protein
MDHESDEADQCFYAILDLNAYPSSNTFDEFGNYHNGQLFT